MTRRRLTAAALLVCAMILSACSGLPMSGPVGAGYSAEDAPEGADFSFRPNSPQPGATTEQIVTGFIDAATSPEGTWAVAQEFLTEKFREEWQATAGVTIAEPGSRRIQGEEKAGGEKSDDEKTGEEQAGDDDPTTDDEEKVSPSGGDVEHVTMTYTSAANVDEFGAYSVAAPVSQALEFTLEQEDGQWRISAAPPGVIMDSDFFEDVYRSYSLMFFDPSWNYLVPDIRWFPYRSAGVATRIASAVVDGQPSDWLARSVATAFPQGTALESGSVVSVDAGGVARISLTDAALEAAPEVLARMQRQLLSSLRTAGINDVAMMVGGVELDVAASGVLPTTLEAWPLVLTDNEVGYLTGNGLEPLPGGIGQVIASTNPTAFARGRTGEVAAVKLPDGRVARATAEDGIAVVDDREGLIDPTIDTGNYIWSVPSAEPGAVHAVTSDGIVRDIAGEWPGASAISSMQVSRDGTRMVAIVTEAGRDWVVAAGVIRDADNNVPTELGVPHKLALLDGSGFAVTWLDDATVGVLLRGETDVILLTQTVGGLGAGVIAPAPDSTTIAAGASITVPRVLTAEGVLFARRGSAWNELAEAVQVLGTQLGVE